MIYKNNNIIYTHSALEPTGAAQTLLRNATAGMGGLHAHTHNHCTLQLPELELHLSGFHPCGWQVGAAVP